MSAPHSIRLRLIGWFRRFINDARQNIAKQLRRDETHAVPGDDTGFCLVPRVNHGGCQRQIDGSIKNTVLNDKIVEHYRGVSVANNPDLLVAQAERFAAANHHLICHQKSPIGTSYDVSSLNAHAVGVQRITAREAGE